MGRRGVPDPVRRLFDDEYAQLVGVAGLLLGNRADGEDVAQEAFLRLCRDWERVRRLERPAAWLQRVAVNVAISRQRRARTEKRSFPLLPGGGEISDPDTSTSMTVRAELLRLPSDERAVIVLRFYLGLSVGEIGEALGCPEGTVKTRTRRAMSALRASGLIEMGRYGCERPI